MKMRCRYFISPGSRAHVIPENQGKISSLYHNPVLVLLILSVLVPLAGYSQRAGYTDNFNSGSLTLRARFGQDNNRQPGVLWGTVTPGTYGLTAADSVLHIKYSRKEGAGAFDKFTFHAFRPINVTSNPHIRFDLRSNIDTKVTVSPVYSEQPPTVEYLETDIPGDNAWHTYTLGLTRDYYTAHNNVSAVDFYFDRDTSVTKTGLADMDNFRIAWYLVNVTGLEAQVNGGANISLGWETSDAERTGSYKIYRGDKPDFKPGKSNLLAEVKTNSYSDNNLAPFKHYFYKVAAVSTQGEEFFPSKVAWGETYKNGVSPTVEVTGTNTATVKKYEKFEALLALDNVGIENPYDPADIDVYADFTAPSGKEMRVNAFYDNFNNVNQWKLRFSPNETGEYKYRVFVRDAGGTGESAAGSFKAVDSKHHGWIRPSEKNPHYFTYDDGTTFYGIGAYSPWGNTMQRFDTYASHNANLLALWDINFGGFVDSHGVIEEQNGRYNQEKLGMLDSLMAILEQRNIKLMLAIWPHDLLSASVWSAKWNLNPYSQFVDAEHFYGDSLAWEYQKMKYRYLVARYGYSRSMGIWELVNEMNGTDGWEKGHHQEAYDWVAKCDKYFRENDPYQHPMTASFSGGFTEYREELYKLTEIPNIHMYPAQGWPKKYPADTMRSAMYNYAWASRRFWDAFDKPAIFGEAGANLSYFQPQTKEYHTSYHNQIWAAFTNGLAATPVWWDFPVLNADDWNQLKNLSHFVLDIDLANRPFKPADASADGSDIFVMSAGNNAFGWARSFTKNDISGTTLNVRGLDGNASCKVEWYDSWSGKIIENTTVPIQNGMLVMKVPKLKEVHPDISFKINQK